MRLTRPIARAPFGARFAFFVALLAIASLAGACGASVSSPDGSPTATAPGGSPTATPGASASTAASARPSGAAATDCPIEPVEGLLGSDRLVSVAVLAGGDADAVIFRFERGAPATTNQPTAHLEAVAPPFVQDPSGLPLEVPGSRYVRVRFDGLTLYDDAGTPTFTGPGRLDPAGGGAVRAVVREGEFEGVSSWIVGFDGTGCVAVAPGDATTTVIRVEVRP